MTEPIFITVPYSNTERQFEIQLQVTAYTHRFIVMVNDVPVFFEPDEERNYRAVLSSEHLKAGEQLDPFLLQKIAETIRKELS